MAKSHSTKKSITRSDSPLFSFRIMHLPKPISKREFFKTLLRGTKTGELPEGWVVNWLWRNALAKGGHGIEREDLFENVLKLSREAYIKLMRKRLKRELAKYPTSKRRKHTNKNRRAVSKVQRKKSKRRNRQRGRKAR